MNRQSVTTVEATAIQHGVTATFSDYPGSLSSNLSNLNAVPVTRPGRRRLPGPAGAGPRAGPSRSSAAEALPGPGPGRPGSVRSLSENLNIPFKL